MSVRIHRGAIPFRTATEFILQTKTGEEWRDWLRYDTADELVKAFDVFNPNNPGTVRCVERAIADTHIGGAL